MKVANVQALFEAAKRNTKRGRKITGDVEAGGEEDIKITKAESARRYRQKSEKPSSRQDLEEVAQHRVEFRDLVSSMLSSHKTRHYMQQEEVNNPGFGRSPV